MNKLLLLTLIAFSLYACNDEIYTGNESNESSNLTNTVSVSIPSDAINVKNYGAKGDGVTSDSKAVLDALKAAQDKGVFLYFPAGTYNLNQWDKPNETVYYNASFQAKKDLKIIGDGSGKSSVINSGNFWCEQGITIKNIKFHTNLSIFLFMDIKSYVNVTFDDLTFSSDQGGSTRFCYAYSNKGIEELNVTNCHFSKIRYGLLLSCNINKGIISNNTFSQLGDKNIRQSMGPICIGRLKTIDGGANAANVIIENNKIKDIYVGGRDKGGPEEEVYALPIMVYGHDVIIKGNRIENLNGAYEHEGIYVKASNVQILNNTLINAGDEEGSICAKGSHYLWVEGNTITSNTPTKPDEPDFSGIQGIMLMADHVYVRNNTIDVSWGFGIRIYNEDSKEVVVEGNKVKTKSYSGISVENQSGKIDILNNEVEVNNSKADAYYSGILLNKLTGKTEVNIKNNKVKTENCRTLFVTGTVENDYFHTAEITGNTFETAAITWESQSSNQISGIHQFLFADNTIIQKPSINSEKKASMMLSVAFGGTTTGKQEIHNNRFIYNGNKCTSAIQVASEKLSIKDNEFDIQKDGMESLVWWIPKTNSSNKAGVISGNKVTGDGTIKDMLYLDMANPVNLGTLTIERNAFNMSGYVIFPVTKWSNHIIADEIMIRNNQIGTKKTGTSIITDSAHSKDTKFTLEGNKLYPAGVPVSTTTGIPVIRM